MTKSHSMESEDEAEYTSAYIRVYSVYLRPSVGRRFPQIERSWSVVLASARRRLVISHTIKFCTIVPCFHFLCVCGSHHVFLHRKLNVNFKRNFALTFRKILKCEHGFEPTTGQIVGLPRILYVYVCTT